MLEEVCGPRVRELADQLDALEARRDRLLRELQAAEPLRLGVGQSQRLSARYGRA